MSYSFVLPFIVQFPPLKTFGFAFAEISLPSVHLCRTMVAFLFPFFIIRRRLFFSSQSFSRLKQVPCLISFTFYFHLFSLELVSLYQTKPSVCVAPIISLSSPSVSSSFISISLCLSLLDVSSHRLFFPFSHQSPFLPFCPMPSFLSLRFC